MLQGPFEKIHLQDLLSQHSLELVDLLPERGLPRIFRRALATRCWLELLSPRIQQPPTDAEVLRQCHNGLALIQPVHCHLPKAFRKLPHTFLGHWPPPSCAKCANSRCLNLGGQSTLVQEVENGPYTEGAYRGRVSISLTRLYRKLRRDGFCEPRHDVLEIGFQLNFLL